MMMIDGCIRKQTIALKYNILVILLISIFCVWERIGMIFSLPLTSIAFGENSLFYLYFIAFYSYRYWVH